MRVMYLCLYRLQFSA
ncbi:unnamed protein product [Staurois parvus]|uniref:Uncharacterized protein n=1 Tax=Staurois parvus TaxID=386267 RepID=A0ABN9G6F4_9NEOB|nr:unnamed protein product [Staurois parvus]